MTEALEIGLQVSLLVFIVGALLDAGLGVTIGSVFGPLKDPRTLAPTLLANLVLAPAVVYGLARLVPLHPSYEIGLLLYGFAAGAPYTPLLIKMAGGEVAKSVGLTLLLTVLTIAYMPVVVPLLVPGASIGAWDIGRPLLLQMFLPLAVGLAIRHYSAGVAARLTPLVKRVTNVCAAVFLVVAVVLYGKTLLGSGAATAGAAAAFSVAIFVLGALVAVGSHRTRVTLGFVACSRNLGAAVVVAAANFADDPDVLLGVLVCLFVALGLQVPAAKLYFKRWPRPPSRPAS